MHTHNLSNYKNKKWTVLIYADGNNDLAPEIYKGFEKIKTTSVSDDINILVQLAIAPDQLVNTLRSNVSFHSLENIGTKRYKIHNKDATLIDDLGNVNMSNPASLSDFILWGITNYPAKHIMVILSGHGAGFAGAMNDYTHDLPYIMSIQGMIHAISKCKKIAKKNIDCLVLDTCYMNLVEVWYEFACTHGQSVKYLIGPLKDIPLEGLPCHLIIKHLQEINHTKLKTRSFLSNIVKRVNKDIGILGSMIAVNLDRNSFIQLKKEINTMSHFIVENNINIVKSLTNLYHYKPSYPLISLLDLESILSTKFSETYTKELNIKKTLESIVVYPKLHQLPQNQNLGPSLYLPRNFNQYLAIKNYYDHLLFANDNKWLNILRRDQTNEQDNSNKNIPSYTNLSSPIPMPLRSIVAVILEQNPHLTIEEGWQIIKNLGWY